MNRAPALALGAALIAAAAAPSAPQLLAQDAVPGRPPAGLAGGNELVEALKASPGCIGVETAFTQSRKAVIFAWFEDKDAVLDWYHGDYHQTAMMGLREAAAAEAGGYEAGGDAAAAEQEPLAHVPDDVGPVLCIATITPSTKQLVPGFDSSISQISIELYAPLPGGIAFNGKFAPEKLKVPHLLEMSADGSPVNPAARAAQGSGQ